MNQLFSSSPSSTCRSNRSNESSSSSSSNVFQSNLSCVLNDPRKTRAELSTFFTKTWGNSFIDRPIDCLSRLVDFTLNDFELYFQSLRQSDKYGRPRLIVQSSSTSDSSTNQEKIHSITNIPQLFFSSQFTLNDNSTFNFVYPGIIPQRTSSIPLSSTSPSPSPLPPLPSPGHEQQKCRTTSTSSDKSDGSTLRRSSTISSNTNVSTSSNSTTKHSISSTSRILQDRYSHYLDEVELLISRSLSTKSDCFHDAVRSHDEIQLFLSRTRSAISSLRSQLIDYDKKSLIRLLNLCSFIRQRRNQRQILKRLQSLSIVRQTHSQVRILLRNQDYLSSLDLIDVTKDILSTDLSDLVSLRFYDQQLTELEILIRNLIREEFQENLHVYFQFDEFQLNSSTNLSLGTNSFDEDKFITILIGLIRVQDDKYLEIFQNKSEEFLCDFIQKILKHFPKDLQTNKIQSKTNSDSTLNDDYSSHSTKTLTSTYSQWSRLIQHLFRCLEKSFEYFENLSQIIFETLSKQNASTLSSYRNLIDFIYDKIDERLIEVLVDESNRFQIHFERLSLDEYSHLIQLIQTFIDKNLSQTKIHWKTTSKSRPLKTFLQGQTSKFLNYFHDERKQRLSTTLENEQWKQVTIPRPIQNSIDEFFSSSSSKIDSTINPNGSDLLIIDDEQFVLSSSSLHLFMLISDYRSCAQMLPLSSMIDVEHRLIELLKLFNSKSCQLVLGAGAVKLGRIRTISAKILALTCRCLQFVKILLPKIKNDFYQFQNSSNGSSSSSTTKQFEQLTKLYSEHIDEIHGKLITIIESTFGDTLSSYEVRAPMPSDCFRTLVTRHIAAFYNAVVRIVSPSDLILLFTRLNSIFKHLLSKRLRQLKIANDGGPQHGLLTSDLLYYIKQVQSLPGLEMLELHVDEIWTTT